ncbi:MAG TPA: SAM-dependent chlorinase/fluorinase, partial [Actinomycetota bacterium]|nr:SAM-dependent chlorinase/fluorinase [Actinomycetota bacterium]
GVCHGVILKIAPHIRIVDIHHNILRQDIRHGAIVLQQAVRFMPAAVHLAVVDPSVGSDRRSVCIETPQAVFIGPDNGLLMPAAEVSGGVVAAHEIVQERYLQTPISRTFQGRDVFAPAAAHVASGVEPSQLGPEVATADLVPLEIPEAWVHDDHLHAEVLQVDRFGNLQLNFTRSHLDKLGEPGEQFEVRIEGHRLTVPLGTTFADVDAGEYVVIEDSYGFLSLAVNKGDAAARLRAQPRSTAIIEPV